MSKLCLENTDFYLFFLFRVGQTFIVVFYFNKFCAAVFFSVYCFGPNRMHRIFVDVVFDIDLSAKTFTTDDMLLVLSFWLSENCVF